MGQKIICFPLPVQPAFERNDSTFAWKSYESGPFHCYAASARSTGPSKACEQKFIRQNSEVYWVKGHVPKEIKYDQTLQYSIGVRWLHSLNDSDGQKQG